MTEEELIMKLEEFRRLPAETEVFEFKEARNNYDSNKLGKFFLLFQMRQASKANLTHGLLSGLRIREEQ